MEKNKKKTHFLQQPEYKGGSKALTTFLYSELKYPKLALEAGIEGQVYIEYDIDYKGNVVETRVLQGLGYGCDEEACRVVKMLKFDVGKNRGVRVLFHKKINVYFKKPVPEPAPVPASPAVLQVQYQITPVAPAPTPAQEEKKEPVYQYTIRF
jgi:TonB family protein